MKKNLLSFLIVLICSSLSFVHAQARNVSAEKLKKLKEYFVLLKSGQQEYKKALKDYDTCVQRHCGAKIEALAKVSENITKANPFDFALIKLLNKSHEYAKTELETCSTEQCKDEREKLDFLTKQLQDRSKILKRAILIIAGGLVVASIGTYAAVKGLPKLRRKIAPTEIERRIDALIVKYNLGERAENKQALEIFLSSPFTGDPNQSLPVVPANVNLTTGMKKALAEAYYGDAAEAIINDANNFRMFGTFLEQNRM